MKRYVRFAIFCFGLGWYGPVCLFGQSEAAIYGSVAAKADGSALSNADIRIESGSTSTVFTAMADSNGRFSFTGLIPGRYTIYVSHENFQDQVLQHTLKQREFQHITFELP